MSEGMSIKQEMSNWEHLVGCDWSTLLQFQPRFADKCDWSKLDGGGLMGVEEA